MDPRWGCRGNAIKALKTAVFNLSSAVGGEGVVNIGRCDDRHSRPLRFDVKSHVVRGSSGNLALPSQKEKMTIEATSRLEGSARVARHRAMTRALRITVLTAVLGATALPVHGYFQSHSFFNPEMRYREWFHVTRWPGEERAGHRTYSALAAKAAAVAAAERYVFPDRKFEMTEALWNKSKRKVETGISDWFDAEVVRQRAEIEEHPPAMDFLAWMYEHGQGIKQDERKAYMWYERAKLAGERELRGVSERIFDRMTPPDQNLAQVQLADDIKRMTPEPEAAPQDYKQINLRVFRQRRGEDFYRQQQEQLERERKPIHR